MFDKLQELEHEYRQIEMQLADPSVLADQGRYLQLSRRYAELGEVVGLFTRHKKLERDIREDREMLHDPELGQLARSELPGLEAEQEALLRQLDRVLLPQDPNDDKNAILEIRAGTGGEEAALFAGDLFDMYTRYAEGQGLKVEVMDAGPNELGGFSKVVLRILGPQAFGALKYESGVHRVQRVPTTETQGRIHTSTATVAVLPEVEPSEFALNMSEIRIDVQRASGPGGQGVNTTDSAVRVLHMPTGTIVTCQDSRSQIKNRDKALTILRSRLAGVQRAREEAQERQDRLAQIGSGERSEKIRTYNFPQSRVTDHRIGFTIHNLEGVLSGDLSELTEALKRADQERMLAGLVEETRHGA